jgi:hypothetical protein
MRERGCSVFASTSRARRNLKDDGALSGESHEALDKDEAMQSEMRHTALAVAEAAHANHAGKLLEAGRTLKPSRQK